MNGGLKLLFVINSHAGTNDISWQDIISNYFTGKSYDVSYFTLGKENAVDELKKQIDRLLPNKVIAVGGDGTVTLVAELITGTHAALGILPAGSANGMARELNIPTNPFEALSIIENGRISTCDAIKINEKYISLHLADIGLNAQLIKYFNEGNLRGKLGYAKVILKTLWRSQKINVIIKAGNNNIKTKAFMIVLANASKYGTGAVINPAGKPDDGNFEVVIVRKLSFIEIIKTFFGPKTLDPGKIETIPATAVKIQTTRKTHFQIDGEYIGKINELRAIILPGYINIVRANKNE